MRSRSGKFAKRRAAGKPAGGTLNVSDTSKRFTPRGETRTQTGGSEARTHNPRRSKDGGGPPKRGKR